jgi:hypothetical protein
MLSAAKLFVCEWFCQRVARALVAFISAVALLSAAVSAQVTYTGTTATQNFGSVAIGSTSAATTFTFSVAAGTTIGSVAVVTQGAPNLDFTVGGGSTCTATTYASATTCTVNVTFNPKSAGLRMGAVVFFSEAGNTGTMLGSVLVYGIGTGPQIAYSPSPVIAISPVVDGEELTNPGCEVVDGSGNLYICDQYKRVLKVPAGGGAAIAIVPSASGCIFEGASGVAVDGAGDLFITDFYNSCVVKVPAGGGAPTAIFPDAGQALYHPRSVVVDGTGDLFIADTGNSRVVEVLAGGGVTVIDPAVDGIGLSSPYGVAVDSAGNVFIADSLNMRVVKVPAGGGAPIAIDPQVNGRGLSAPTEVAVDGAGNLYISDSYAGVYSRVVEVPVDGGAVTVIDPTVNNEALNMPRGMAVDGAGDLFIADEDNGRVVEILRSQPASFNFPTITEPGRTDTADGIKTAKIQNIGNEELIFTSLSYPADFSEASGDPIACTGSTSLAAGQQCDLPVEFAPQQGGLLNEAVTLTDNALNASGAQQLIQVTGTATALAVLTSPRPGTTVGYSDNTFSWTSGYGVTRYQLWLGISGPGSSDMYSSGVTSATFVVVPTLPALGVTLYARLFTFNPVAGAWQYHDYTYTLVGPILATLTLPAQGTTVGYSNVTFSWTPNYAYSHYRLHLGVNGPGSSDIYSSSETSATSVVVPTLPALGVTLYARLFTLNYITNVWQYNDYTFTLAGPILATLTSPTPGTTVGTSNVTFAWTPNHAFSHYRLYLGTGGPGSANVYSSSQTGATSVMVPTIPATGGTLYARLFTLNSETGVWQYNDYTYTMSGP